MIQWCRYRLYTLVFTLLVFTLRPTCSFSQTIIKPKVLSNSEWQNYFSKYYKVKSTEDVKTVTPQGDIPYPLVWKYAGDKDKDKTGRYLLYTVNATADFMIMPSNNGVGTYLLYFDHAHPEKNWVEMNFLADSVLCKQLTHDTYMFQFNDDGFKINGDNSGFKRYVFVSSSGKIATQSVVAHTCSVNLNSIDSTKNIVYLNVIYANGSAYRKNFRLDYKNFLLRTDMNDVEDLNGSIVIDAVHYTAIKSVEGTK